MARGTWDVYVNESGSSWTDDFDLYIPNIDLSEEKISNQRNIILADGSKAFFTPETKYAYQNLTFSWQWIVVADGLISKIEDYITDNDRLKIVTHLSVEYIGYFTNINKMHLVGQDPDAWDIEATFLRE